MMDMKAFHASDCPELVQDPNKEARLNWAYYEGLRALSLDEKLKIVQLHNEIWERTVRAGIRKRHPEYDEEQIKLALCRIRYGDHVFSTFFPQARIDL